MAASQVLESFWKSLGMVASSEIGDKTFFIAAILAVKHPRSTVLTGCLGALALMTALSAALGWATPALVRLPVARRVDPRSTRRPPTPAQLSKTWTHWASTLLFFYFGLRSLYDILIAKARAP